MLIDADRGHTIKPGRIGDEESATEIESSRTHDAP